MKEYKYTEEEIKQCLSLTDNERNQEVEDPPMIEVEVEVQTHEVIPETQAPIEKETQEEEEGVDDTQVAVSKAKTK
ncbi:hypothetical protein L2E82_27790 [Cichorium intybus]|uniref:Uncharacterized protein n=1 Tax=Cichorium intybus TaxID=13427 RepID=A0ACB9CUE6_CICIN|nr:hypothetical protein L2E82_27790 [Cichorium intybus]